MRRWTPNSTGCSADRRTLLPERVATAIGQWAFARGFLDLSPQATGRGGSVYQKGDSGLLKRRDTSLETASDSAPVQTHSNSRADSERLLVGIRQRPATLDVGQGRIWSRATGIPSTCGLPAPSDGYRPTRCRFSSDTRQPGQRGVALSEVVHRIVRADHSPSSCRADSSDRPYGSDDLVNSRSEGQKVSAASSAAVEGAECSPARVMVCSMMIAGTAVMGASFFGRSMSVPSWGPWGDLVSLFGGT